MIFRQPSGAFVIVPQVIVDTAFRYARPPLNNSEAGGILIGQYRGAHVELVDCTTPMPTDIRSRFGFDRSDPGHAIRALEAWSRSGQVQTFVGEWHTHPVQQPSPSPVDLRTWANIRKRTQDDPVVFMIFGTSGMWCGLGCRDGLTPLEAVE